MIKVECSIGAVAVAANRGINDVLLRSFKISVNLTVINLLITSF